MVSLWPFKSTDDTASFEKTLSSVSSKISKANVTRDTLRARSRRYKVLWTLYTSLAYLLSAIILVLVTGWRNWGPIEYTAVSGSPLVIYLVRATLSSYYDYRLSSNDAHLAQLHKQREEAIEKFKTATKYNTTQQLLEKYGAAPPSKPATAESPKKSSSSRNNANRAQQQQQQQQPRTGIAPPATANIRRPGDNMTPASSSPTPSTQTYPQQQSTPNPADPRYATFTNIQNTPSQQVPSPTAEFAPNAYNTAPPQYSRSSNNDVSHHSQWYDRIMDLLLGEDETKPSNRLALICEHCRLINGQAPPGIRTLEDVGRWRCMACKGWNGVDKSSEVKKILGEVAGGGAGGGGVSSSPDSPSSPSSPASPGSPISPDAGDDGDSLDEVDNATVDGDGGLNDSGVLRETNEIAHHIAELEDDEDNEEEFEIDDDGVDIGESASASDADADEPPSRSTRSQKSTKTTTTAKKKT